MDFLAVGSCVTMVTHTVQIALRGKRGIFCYFLLKYHNLEFVPPQCSSPGDSLFFLLFKEKVKSLGRCLNVLRLEDVQL